MIFKKLSTELIMAIAAACMAVGVLSLLGYIGIAKDGDFGTSSSVPLLAVAVSSSIAILYFSRLLRERSRLSTELDVQQRSISAEIEISERRIAQQVQRLIDRQISQLVNGDEVVSKLLDQKLSNGIILSVEKALSERVAPESRRIRLQRFLEDVSDRLRIKYDGPAGRAEKSANNARRIAYALALSGLALALWRVHTSAGFSTQLIDLLKADKADHIWPVVAAQAAPWVALVLLVEATALVFFRFYVRSIELQRYFTRELANIESRFCALRIITEMGSDEQVVKAAVEMMVFEENRLDTGDLNDLKKRASVFWDAASRIKDNLSKKGGNE